MSTTTRTTDILYGFADEVRDLGTGAWQAYNQAANVTAYGGEVPIDAVKALIDYPLIEGPLQTTMLGPDGDPVLLDDPDRKVIVRGDTGALFGVFKKGYQIHQPGEWLYRTLENLLDDDLKVGQARLIRGGAVALITVENPDTREAGSTGAEPVKFRPYLTAMTSHDGSYATSYFTGNVMLQCLNQMGHLMRDAKGHQHKVRHSSNSLGQLGAVRDRLGLVVARTGDAFAAEVERLTAEYVSDATWTQFVRALTGVDDKPEGRARSLAESQIVKLDELWHNDPRVAPWKNSAYGVAQAVNTAQQWAFNVKGATRDERNTIRTIEGKWDTLTSRSLRILEEVSR